MNVTTIGVVILFVILGGFSLWYKSNAKVNAKVTGLIAAAEKEYQSWTNAGEKKFEWVVDQLYALIPVPVRPFISRTLVSRLVQSTYDAVEGYAGMQLDKLAAKSADKRGDPRD